MVSREGTAQGADGKAGSHIIALALVAVLFVSGATEAVADAPSNDDTKAAKYHPRQTLLKVEARNLTDALKPAKEIDKKFLEQFDLGQRSVEQVLGQKLQVYNLSLGLMSIQTELEMCRGGKALAVDWKSSDRAYLLKRLSFQRETVVEYKQFFERVAEKVSAGAATETELLITEYEYARMRGDLRLTGALIKDTGGGLPPWAVAIDLDAPIERPQAANSAPGVPVSPSAEMFDPNAPVLDPNAGVLDPNAPIPDPSAGVLPAGGPPLPGPSGPDPASGSSAAPGPASVLPNVDKAQSFKVTTLETKGSTVAVLPPLPDTGPEIAVRPGQDFHFDFKRDDAKYYTADEDLLVVFDQSRTVVLLGFIKHATDVSVRFRDGGTMPGPELLATANGIEAFAEKLTGFETCGHCGGGGAPANGHYRLARDDRRGLR